jgi:uncharacterized protein
MESVRRAWRDGVTVTGSGSAAATVDQVMVTFGITVVRAEPGDAFQAAANSATRVLAILADDGVDSRSVRTADLTLGPKVDWRDNQEVLLGYQAGQRLVVQLTGLAGMERMLTDVAVGGGEGVRIDSMSLTPSDPSFALRDARAAAFSDALAKASQLAQLGGRMLGDLLWLDERHDAAGGPSYIAASQPLSMGKSMPIAAGDAQVFASVTAHWKFAGEPR